MQEVDTLANAELGQSCTPWKPYVHALRDMRSPDTDGLLSTMQSHLSIRPSGRLQMKSLPCAKNKSQQPPKP